MAYLKGIWGEGWEGRKKGGRSQGRKFFGSQLLPGLGVLQVVPDKLTGAPGVQLYRHGYPRPRFFLRATVSAIVVTVLPRCPCRELLPLEQVYARFIQVFVEVPVPALDDVHAFVNQ